MEKVKTLLTLEANVSANRRMKSGNNYGSKFSIKTSQEEDARLVSLLQVMLCFPGLCKMMLEDIFREISCFKIVEKLSQFAPGVHGR